MQGSVGSSGNKFWSKTLRVPVGSGANPDGAPLGALFFRTDELKLYIQIGVGAPGADAKGWFNLKNAQYAA